ncbi:hypothetical protein KsCSTR_45100 [Candidatus Kuenenia stuttgartiensis]|uniref:Uncharacterized protein n=1 Tax=Kuenenia stuttgartiensis TaxID=174633 RepID=Q1PWM7_KUEST|nr:hypothetical protein KsCSTR_45100 [Candidatus Kuenenia stuttgartiensis]CAJ71626.1 hypothetical protein kustc0881 [Candidatus Kuenenia stuttgartiensis]
MLLMSELLKCFFCQKVPKLINYRGRGVNSRRFMSGGTGFILFDGLYFDVTQGVGTRRTNFGNKPELHLFCLL